MSRIVQSCQEYFDTLAERFVPTAAKGVKTVIFFDLQGEGGGAWAVHVDDGTFTVTTGPVEKPAVTIQMKPEHYVQMANGDLDGTKAFMTRKLKVSGSIPMAQKMKSFLPPHSKK